MKLLVSLMKRTTFVAILALWCLAAVNHASATTVRFVNSEVNLGTASQIDLSNQYNAFGLQFTDVYRYIDSRDTFSDAPNQVGGSNLGISNGRASQSGPGVTGRVDFLGGTTPSISFDWWTIGGNSIVVDAYNALNVSQGSFTGAAGSSGTAAINGDIAYFTFHDDGGFTAIANLSYRVSSSAPDAGSTCLLLGMAITGLSLLRRKVG
jgi:hypothetical protein